MKYPHLESFILGLVRQLGSVPKDLSSYHPVDSPTIHRPSYRATVTRKLNWLVRRGVLVKVCDRYYPVQLEFSI